MKHRWLMTIAACLCVTALSASSVLAARPDSANRGSATSGGHGKPAKNELHPNQGKHLGQSKPADADPADNDDGDSEEVDTDHERPHNHGWWVSEVAKDHSVTGRAHGEAVSEMARSDKGKPEQASH